MKWISVEDKLPKLNDLVICFCDNGFINAGYLCYPGTKEDFNLCSTGLLKYFSCGDRKITHWMPLPEPPKD